jgi:uncharacterized membrane protein
METQARVDPRISRKALVLPGLIPLLVAGGMLLFHHFWRPLNPHGVEVLVVLAVYAWGAVATVVEVVLVPKAIVQAVRSPSLRTPGNLLSIAFGAAFLVVVLAVFLYAAVIAR